MARASLPSIASTRHWASKKDGRMMKRTKVELVLVEADSDTQRVLERLIKALEKQGFKIIRKDTE